MAAVIARVAGVESIIACAPTDRSTGRIPDVILAAAEIAGVDALYALGGAQAIAAMAFGTETVPAVDKIVGPGGLFVTLAKRRVFGTVGIDGLPGPTETVVIADETANPAWVAADLLAQAEHDVLATAILLTPSRELARAVQEEIGHRLEQLSRDEIIAESLTHRGGAVITPDLNAAVDCRQCLRCPNIFACPCKIPGHWSQKFAMPVAFSLATPVSRCLVTTLPGHRTSCPPRAPPASLHRSTWKISSSASASSALRPPPAPNSVPSLPASPMPKASTPMPPLRGKELIVGIRYSCLMSKNIQYSIPNLIRPDIAQMEEYTPVQPFEVLSKQLGRKPEEIVKLNANENPYGPSPHVQEALSRFPWYHIYPDPQQNELREALADYVGVPADYILPGHGADELLDYLCRLFLLPDRCSG